MIHHKINLPSHHAIFRIKQRRAARYWFSANGELVGVWKARNGKTYAVGHDIAGRTIVYLTSARWEA